MYIMKMPSDRLFWSAAFSIMGRIDPVEYVGVSQQRNGDVRNINHPLCGCAVIVIQKITFPSIIEVSKPL